MDTIMLHGTCSFDQTKSDFSARRARLPSYGPQDLQLQGLRVACEL